MNLLDTIFHAEIVYGENFPVIAMRWCSLICITSLIVRMFYFKYIHDETKGDLVEDTLMIVFAITFACNIMVHASWVFYCGLIYGLIFIIKKLYRLVFNKKNTPMLISFKQFKKFYYLNPGRYYLSERGVYMKGNNLDDNFRIYIEFRFLDNILYKMFYNQINKESMARVEKTKKQKEIDAQNKIMSEIITCVKSDISKIEKEADDKIKKAKEISEKIKL